VGTGLRRCDRRVSAAGVACPIFYNSIIGSLMTLTGLAFGKLSGPNDMVSSSHNDTEK